SAATTCVAYVRSARSTLFGSDGEASLHAPPIIAQSREVDGDLADLRIGMQQRDLIGIDERYLAFDPVLRIIRSAYAGAFAGLRIALLRVRWPGRGGSRGPCDGKALIGCHIGALAVADGCHPIVPGDQPGIGIELRAAIDSAAAQEPDDVIAGEIG